MRDLPCASAAGWPPGPHARFHALASPLPCSSTAPAINSVLATASLGCAAWDGRRPAPLRGPGHCAAAAANTHLGGTICNPGLQARLVKHIHTNVRTHTQTHSYLSKHTSFEVFILRHVPAFLHNPTHLPTHMRACTYPCMHAQALTHTPLHVQAYIKTRTHAHASAHAALGLLSPPPLRARTLQLYTGLPEVVKSELEAHPAGGPPPPFATHGSLAIAGMRSFRLIQELPLPGERPRAWACPCVFCVCIRMCVCTCERMCPCTRVLAGVYVRADVYVCALAVSAFMAARAHVCRCTRANCMLTSTTAHCSPLNPLFWARSHLPGLCSPVPGLCVHACFGVQSRPWPAQSCS